MVGVVNIRLRGVSFRLVSKTATAVSIKASMHADLPAISSRTTWSFWVVVDLVVWVHSNLGAFQHTLMSLSIVWDWDRSVSAGTAFGNCLTSFDNLARLATILSLWFSRSVAPPVVSQHGQFCPGVLDASIARPSSR